MDALVILFHGKCNNNFVSFPLYILLLNVISTHKKEGPRTKMKTYNKDVLLIVI